MKFTIVSFIALLLIASVGCSRNQQVQPAAELLASRCASAPAPFYTLIIDGEIESIMALADDTSIDIAEKVYAPLTYRRCEVNGGQVLVVEPLSADQAERLKRHFEANAEGSQAFMHQNRQSRQDKEPVGTDI